MILPIASFHSALSTHILGILSQLIKGDNDVNIPLVYGSTYEIDVNYIVTNLVVS